MDIDLNILVRISVVIKHHKQKHLGEESIYFSSHFQPCIAEGSQNTYSSQIETWTQKLKQNQLRSVAYQLAIHSFFSILSYTILNHPL